MINKEELSISTKDIKKKAKENLSYGKAIRNYLHTYPEQSNKEYKTSKFLQNELENMGYEIIKIPNKNSFLALLDSGKAGKTLGFRSDMDGLKILEDSNNLSQKREVISKNKGLMHACGHDGHMAIALTSAKILKDYKDILKGKIYFIFEQAEETCEGVGDVISFIKDKNISFDAIYGNHVDPSLDIGKFSIKDGIIQAGSMGFDVDIYGKGGHGSRPDLSNSPIQALVKIIDNLESLWISEFDPRDNISLSIGSINAGSAPNIIDDKANFKGTARFIKDETGEKALNLFKNIVENTAKLYSSKVNFNDYTKIVTYPTINDEKLAKLSRNVANSLFENPIVDKKMSFGSETFSAYANITPTVFVELGIKNKKYGSGSNIHTKNFDLDPNVIYYASSLLSTFAFEILTK